MYKFQQVLTFSAVRKIPATHYLGFAFLVNDDEEVDGMEDAGVALVRAYNYVRDEMDDNGKALSFLAGVSHV